MLLKSQGSSGRSSSSVQNHRVFRLEGMSGGHLDQPHAQNRADFRVRSGCSVLSVNTSKAGDCTAGVCDPCDAVWAQESCPV